MVDFTGNLFNGVTARRRSQGTILKLCLCAVFCVTVDAAIKGRASTFEYRSPLYYSQEYSYLSGTKVPQNEKPSNSSFADDGCGDNSVRFKSDGYCYPVLRQGPCENLRYWVTVDPDTYEGVCTPRLCGRERVFVGRDGLCHDIYDSYECSGGRRLYYSAYGDPICDCPVGQYPYPTDEDDCVPLFTQGPCKANEVLSVSSSGKLECAPDTCQSMEKFFEDFLLQFAPAINGDSGEAICYALGTRGPCSSPSEYFGYNIFNYQGECVDIEDPTSPYFSSSEENARLDDIYNKAENDTKSVSLQKRETRHPRTRRQGFNTGGIFQQAGRVPASLLNPCQLGSRSGNNFKCTNPLVPNKPRRDINSAIGSAFGCQGNDFLLATGQCSSDRRAATCGPSYQFVAATNQCRPKLLLKF